MTVIDHKHKYIKPLVDTNTILAIETIFSKDILDPWAIQLACTFVDLFIYADCFRFTLAFPTDQYKGDDFSNAPSLIQNLKQRDSSAIVAEIVPNDEPVKLDDKYLNEAFHLFAVWARNNVKSLKQWLKTHKTPTINAMNQAQLDREYYFNLERLMQNIELTTLSTELQLAQDYILYAFDNLLRGPLYGKLTGDDQHYLNHPMRNVSLLPTFEAKTGPLPNIPISFKDTMLKMVNSFEGRNNRTIYAKFI